MAANSRSERFNQISRSFKDRLQALECPLTEEVDESWIVQLIFTPGEPRIKLLQWLFSRFDTKLADLLDAQYIPTDTRMDARLQRLLYISSVLGLCGPDDIDLIRGASTKSKQIAYMDQLLDLVCIVDASEDPAKRAMSSPGLIDESLSLREQVEHDYQLIDCIAREQDINSLFSDELTLLPPDLMKQMQKSLKEQGITSQQQYSPPDYQNLLEVLSEVAKQLIKSTTHLEELKHNYAYPEYEEQLSERVCKTMQLVLSELAQLVTGFTFTFENEIRQWCNRAPPVLTDIGAAFKTVYTLLQKFTDILQSFSSVKTSFLNVSQKAETSLQRDSSTAHGPANLASACTEGMDTLRNCINILETSVSAQSGHSARK
ncbi:HAUS augmin-like complex subunit 7 [Ptychodera flava]|uniref:HAUS augmin-like complex subunit 7 n=1 Tax=Ptychodera flava TaxID=63121 RepID=UPI00396A2B31